MTASAGDRTCVLVVRLSAMGDVVQSLGAVRSLLAARPDLDVHQVVQRPFAPLLEDLGLASVVPFDRHGGLGAFRAVIGRVRTLRPAVALDLQGNWKSASIARWSGAGEVIGAVGPGRREPRSRWLLRSRVACPHAHPAQMAFAVVRAFAPEAEARRPELRPRPAELAREVAAIRALGIDPERPFRAVVLGVQSDPRAIREAALGREAEGADRPLLLVAGPVERDLEVPAGLPVLRHAPGEVRRLIALGAVVRDAGGDVFGPDTGATHVLAATGAPTLAAFGPHDPARTAPPAAIVLRRPDPPECMPCGRRTCRHPDGPVCMDLTTGEAVRSNPSPA